MNTENSMQQTPAATITEKELWALFVGHTMKTTFSMGPTVEQYNPDDLLRDPGVYGYMDDFANELANELLDSDEPEITLDCYVEDLKTYIGNLEMLSSAFAMLKVSLATTDHEARYQVPTVHDSATASRA